MANINIGGGGGPGSDTTAIHVDQPNEINGIPVKAVPTAADVIAGEDAANSFAKIKIPLGSLPTVPGDADQLIVPAIKGTPGTILNGQLVYITGFDGGAGAITVELARADSAATMPAYGFATASFDDITAGTLSVAGTLTGQNTAAFAVGDQLFASATTAGAVQNTRPTGTALVQAVGVVDISDAVNGAIQVTGAGRVNALPNLPLDFIWVGDATGIPVAVNKSTVGAPLTSAAPADVTKAAAAVGVATESARADHKHDVTTAIAGAIAIADVAAEGTATTLARSDHKHSLAAPAAPADVTKAAAAAGASSSPARADHKHDVSTAAPVSVGSSNVEGTATTLARSDHQHAHGNQLGGALHANVIPAGASGFMTGAQATQLGATDPAGTARPPTAHASSHASIGSDPLAVVDLTRAKGDYTDAEITLSHVIGTPTVDELDRYKDVTGGVSTTNGGGGITSDGDGTITVAAGQGFIRSVDSDISDLFSFDFAAEAGANVALVDQALNFVYVEYNAGAPQTVATTIKRTDTNTNLFLGTVFRDGTFLHITDQQTPSGNVADKLVRRFSDTDGLTWANGAIISETGTRNIALTAGEFWLGLSEFIFAAFDSSVASSFFRYYRDGVGGWTQDAGETQINNTQYDDGSGTLATLSANRYGVHWVYAGVDDDVYVIFGRGNYTLNQAGAANPPGDIPPQMRENHAALAGKIVIQESAAVFESIETAFTIQFTAAGVTDHGDLAGLADDDHTQYHNNTRGDLRYYTQSAADALLAAKIGDSDFAGTYAGQMQRTGVGAYSIIKNNLGAVLDPVVGNDSTQDYAVGSRWVNTLLAKEFVCLDASIGAADWDQTNGGGGGSGDVTGPASSVDRRAVIFDLATGKVIKQANLHVGDATESVGTRTMGANANLCGGYISKASDTILATGVGSVAIGVTQGPLGTVNISATGIGSVTLAGGATGAGGDIVNVTNSGDGSLVLGFANPNLLGVTSTINCTTIASVVQGNAEQGATIECISGSDGSFVQGQAKGTAAIIRSTSGKGNFVQGVAGTGGVGGTIIAAGSGGILHGFTDTAGTMNTALGSLGTAVFGTAFGTGDITGGGVGSFTGGFANGAGASITATGSGAMAYGAAFSTTIAATATGSIQFGVGTNAVANSLQIGNTTNGLRFNSGGTTSTVNGSFWTDGTDVFVRTGGITKNMTNI